MRCQNLEMVKHYIGGRLVKAPKLTELGNGEGGIVEVKGEKVAATATRTASCTLSSPNAFTWAAW